MSRFWTLSGVVASAASLAIVGIALRASAKPANPSPPASAFVAPAAELAAEGGFSYVGAGSCAAAACHGGVTPVGDSVSHALRNEHTTWVNKDAHAGAYEVLLGDRSKQIAKNLAKGGATFVEAHRDSRCLACHETPRAPGGSADGVSCESCHGPAGAWLSEHTAYDWKGKDKAAFGYRDLTNLGTRAETCAACHVGAPAKDGVAHRDVNHDLIAAGHPRLNWEFSANSANYPKHWRISTAEGNQIDAQSWKVGQVATMAAALDLLEARADLAVKKSGPWPEFTEYGCYSCHFSLNEKLRSFPHDPAVPLGSPAWGSWNTPMLKLLAEIDPTGLPIDAKLKAVRDVMGNLKSNPAAVAAPAKALRADLDAWLKANGNKMLSPGDVAKLFDALNAKAQDTKNPVVTGWDSAAQLYLALTAVHASQKNLAPASTDALIESELRTKLEQLGFKKGFDSPHDESK